MCQDGCQLLKYNSTLKKANCDCKVQTENNQKMIYLIKLNFKNKQWKTFKNILLFLILLTFYLIKFY